jgi:hypothetical protein
LGGKGANSETGLDLSRSVTFLENIKIKRYREENEMERQDRRKRRRLVGFLLLALLLALSLGYVRWGNYGEVPPSHSRWTAPVLAADPSSGQNSSSNDLSTAVLNAPPDSGSSAVI